MTVDASLDRLFSQFSAASNFCRVILKIWVSGCKFSSINSDVDMGMEVNEKPAFSSNWIRRGDCDANTKSLIC